MVTVISETTTRICSQESIPANLVTPERLESASRQAISYIQAAKAFCFWMQVADTAMNNSGNDPHPEPPYLCCASSISMSVLDFDSIRTAQRAFLSPEPNRMNQVRGPWSWSKQDEGGSNAPPVLGRESRWCAPASRPRVLPEQSRI